MTFKRLTPAARPVLLDAAQFESRVRAHESFVAGRPDGRRALLRYAVARALRCDRRKLPDADFTAADLSGTTFVGADLSRSSFYCANLTRCDFRGATLLRSDLRGATFAGAKLGGANLDQADMRAAILCVADEALGLRWVGGQAQVAGSRLNGADLTDAVAFAVDFSNCSLKGAMLRNANLKNANFTDANLDGVDLAGAKLAGVTLTGAILTNVDTGLLQRSGVQLAGCVLDPTGEAIGRRDVIAAEIDRSHRWIESNGDVGQPAGLDDLDLRPAGQLFRNRLLGGMNARRTIGVGVDFSGAQLQGAVFDDADLRAANFTGADLRGVSFLR
ncbi:MAG TPA: pentapeptide repeat-containing protein, partial [Caulobacter sp.]|nr:pentapeptide repeat-containing protein [Caulobacter sp.]